MSPYGSPQTASPHGSHKEHRTLDKADSVEDDQRSTLSQESGVPRADGALHSLLLVAGNRVRHGRCAPEFLEEMAAQSARDSSRRTVAKKLKVISGQEARVFFRNYISEHSKRTSNDKPTNSAMPSPIVFAVTAWEGSVKPFKCVDYYMTWRGIKNANLGKDVERRVEVLDAEFRRLAKKLDDEYKRITSLRTHGNLSPIKQKFDTKPHTSHPSRKGHAPPGITLSSPEDAENATREVPIIAGLPEPPVSAADSVISLPFLNMVRNVPASHHIPLRVTNPDRLSMISDIISLPVEQVPSKLRTEAQIPLADSRNTMSIPAVVRSSKHTKDETSRRSSASILSSDTNSSRWSRSSRASSLSRSENRSSSLDRHRGRESAVTGEKRPYTDEDLPEFLIVFLGDKLERDTTSWHGLERQTSVRSLPPDRHSPWIGPLARAESIGLRYSPSRTPSDTESEDSGVAESWKGTPVVPIKPLMEAMGLVQSYYPSPPVVPGARYVTASQMGSPGPNQSPYLYSSPHLEGSPYMPWPMHIPPHVPSSRPPSRAYSASSRGSPYVQSHLPF